MWYEVKVQLRSELDSGKIKKSSEFYLVEAVSVTDAETKIHKDFEGTTMLDWAVMDVKTSRVCKVLDKEPVPMTA